MEIIVKPKNIYNLSKMKANAFIFGIKDFSVNASCLVDLKTISYLTKKLSNKKIFVSFDANIFDKDINKLKQILLKIDKLNIKGIFFYDLALLELKKELKLKTPLIWNQNFLVTNYETINYYQTLGVKNVLLSSEITVSEVLEIAKNTKSNLFINGFGYQLMGFSKRHLVTNYFKHIKKKNLSNNHYLIEKNDKYKITEEKLGTAILSKDILNTTKEINNYKKIGIKYYIIDEKNIKRKDFLYVLNLLNEVISKKTTEEKLKEYNNKINNRLNTNTFFMYQKTIYKVK